MYFPMICTLKAKIVPEENRSAIYNFYRVPLNVIAVLVTRLDLMTAFFLTTSLLLVAAFFQTRLMGLRLNPSQDYKPVSHSYTAPSFESAGPDTTATEDGVDADCIGKPATV